MTHWRFLWCFPVDLSYIAYKCRLGTYFDTKRVSSEYLLTTLLIISTCAQVVLRTCCNLHSLAKIFCMIYCTCDNMSGKLWRTHCPMWACYQSSYYSDAIWVICESVADFIPKSAWTRTRLWFVGVQGWIQKRCVGSSWCCYNLWFANWKKYLLSHE